MALISLNHEANIMQFAGAYNPLYILREKKLHNNKTLEEWKGDLDQIDDIIVLGLRI